MQQYSFLHTGVLCPKCRCLLVNDSEDKIPHYKCCNCDFTTDNLDNLSLSFDDVPELTLLSEDEQESIKKYRFEYIDKNSLIKDGFTSYTRIGILGKDNLDVGTVVVMDSNATLTLEVQSESDLVDEKVSKVYSDIAETLGYCNKDFNTKDSIVDFHQSLRLLDNSFDDKYLYNQTILDFERQGILCNVNDLYCIFMNIASDNFDIKQFMDCQFRVLNCDILNDVIDDSCFDTPTIYKLLQVIRDNAILCYILVSQQYPITQGYELSIVNLSTSEKLLRDLCSMYSEDFNSKFIVVDLKQKVCPKCGKKYCTCGIEEKISSQFNVLNSLFTPRTCSKCGKIFCICNFGK